MWFASGHLSREIGGRGSRPTGVCSPGRRCHPTYDIQLLTASNEKPVGNRPLLPPGRLPCPLGTDGPIPLSEHNHVSTLNKTWVITTRTEIHRGQADLRGRGVWCQSGPPANISRISLSFPLLWNTLYSPGWPTTIVSQAGLSLLSAEITSTHHDARPPQTLQKSGPD